MSAGEMLNKPVKVMLAGNEYKLARLSCMQMQSIAEDYVREQMMARIKSAAEILPEDQRMAFVSSEMEKIPVGVDLEAKCRPLLDGKTMPNEIAWRMLHEAIRVHNDLTLDEAINLYEDASQTEALTAFRALAGKADAPASGNSKPSRGNSGGRRKKSVA